MVSKEPRFKHAIVLYALGMVIVPVSVIALIVFDGGVPAAGSIVYTLVTAAAASIVGVLLVKRDRMKLLVAHTLWSIILMAGFYLVAPVPNP